MAHILVIDDARWVLDYISDALESQGHIVTTMMNPSKERFSRNLGQYDLVITDVFMPDVDGFEVITTARHASKNTKIIAISGGGAFMLASDALYTAQQLSADACLKKPFTAHELCGTVQQVLAS